ncbi:hypothetical protein D1872_288890 [compost metagenome]
MKSNHWMGFILKREKAKRRGNGLIIIQNARIVLKKEAQLGEISLKTEKRF